MSLIYVGEEEVPPHACPTPYINTSRYKTTVEGTVVARGAIYQCDECGYCWRIKLKYTSDGSPYDSEWVAIHWYDLRRRLTIARYGKDKS